MLGKLVESGEKVSNVEVRNTFSFSLRVKKENFSHEDDEIPQFCGNFLLSRQSRIPNGTKSNPRPFDKRAENDSLPTFITN